MQNLTEATTSPYAIYMCPGCRNLFCGRGLQLQICTCCRQDILHSLDPATAAKYVDSTALYCITCLRVVYIAYPLKPHNTQCYHPVCAAIPEEATICP